MKLLIDLLERSRETIVTESLEMIERVASKGGLKHYSFGGPETTKNKMDMLYVQITQSTKEKNLIPIVNYIEKIAEKRFESGFELQEVQVAINILEECIWQHILEELPKDYQPKALSLVSSIIGSGKDTLARTYLSMATDKPAEPDSPSKPA